MNARWLIDSTLGGHEPFEYVLDVKQESKNYSVAINVSLGSGSSGSYRVLSIVDERGDEVDITQELSAAIEDAFHENISDILATANLNPFN